MTVNRRGLPPISAAASLTPSNQQILLAYLHLLHMQEFIHAPGSYYRNYAYHWVRFPLPARVWSQAHWV